MEAGFWFWITFAHGAHWDEKLITHPGLTSGAHSVNKNEGAEPHPNILWEADLYNSVRCKSLWESLNSARVLLPRPTDH